MEVEVSNKSSSDIHSGIVDEYLPAFRNFEWTCHRESLP